MSLQWVYRFHHLWKKGTLANGFLWSLGFWAFLSRKFFIRCSCSGEFTRNSKVFSTNCNSLTCLWNLECRKHIYVWICQTKPFPKNKGWIVHTVLRTSCPHWLWSLLPDLTQYHWWNVCKDCKSTDGINKTQQIPVWTPFPRKEEITVFLETHKLSLLICTFFCVTGTGMVLRLYLLRAVGKKKGSLSWCCETDNVWTNGNHYYSYKRMWEGWRVGSVVKSTCCSCRPGWTSSTHITAIPNSSPRNPTLFWLSWAPDTHGAQTNMQTKHSYRWGHIINIFLKRGNVRIERIHGHHPGWLLLNNYCYCTIRRR